MCRPLSFHTHKGDPVFMRSTCIYFRSLGGYSAICFPGRAVLNYGNDRIARELSDVLMSSKENSDIRQVWCLPVRIHSSPSLFLPYPIPIGTPMKRTAKLCSVRDAGYG